MELEFETFFDDVYDKMHEDDSNYTKLLKNNTDICNVCLMDKREEGNINLWDKYQLKCKHVIHTRCARAWFCKKTVICPLCDEQPTENHKYCNKCNEWGHCCKFIGHKIYEAMYNNKNINNEQLKTLIKPLLKFNDPKHVIIR